MENKTVFEIKVPKDNEYTPESMVQALSNLISLGKSQSFWQGLFGGGETIVSLELAVFEQKIHFFAVVDSQAANFFESQFQAAYPLAWVGRVENYLKDWGRKLKHKSGALEEPHFGQMVLAKGSLYPLKTYQSFRETDPLSSALSVMSRSGPPDKLAVQMVLTTPQKGWQAAARKSLEWKDKEGKAVHHPDARVIEEKIKLNGFRVGIRLLTNSAPALEALKGSFGAFARGDGNTLIFASTSKLKQKKFLEAILSRKFKYAPRGQMLNLEELATLWHPPGAKMKIAHISWQPKVLSEAPENLPVSTGLTGEEKKEINFLGKTYYKNAWVNFGIKNGEDRRRHVYIIGKTGTGKSTLIANMAIADIRNNQGLAVVDPHGDLCEILLDYIPSHRINDVIYLNPTDIERPVVINPLEVFDKNQKELVASGIVSIFQKLYAHSWGPRLEHVLRNTLLTLVEVDETTLIDITTILTNKGFRDKIVNQLKDPVLTSFWRDEFGKQSREFQSEAISPILNKVGQFTASSLIRKFLAKPKSSFDFREAMDEGKILLVNLSSGRLGEDNAALLGAMIITKIQLASMGRVDTAKEKRRDFFLYVDEFQNFATTSFIKIVSEARKFHLNLTLANQYTAQVPLEVQKAIFGNVGTLVAFVLGASDGRIIASEFGGEFEEKDFLSLSRFQIATKLAIEEATSNPFLAFTLPLPKSKNQNREKAIRVSRERWGKG